jgi:hypothetical protein
MPVLSVVIFNASASHKVYQTDMSFFKCLNVGFRSTIKKGQLFRCPLKYLRLMR